jgi:hypothetical protein
VNDRACLTAWSAQPWLVPPHLIDLSREAANGPPPWRVTQALRYEKRSQKHGQNCSRRLPRRARPRGLVGSRRPWSSSRMSGRLGRPGHQGGTVLLYGGQLVSLAGFVLFQGTNPGRTHWFELGLRLLGLST